MFSRCTCRRCHRSGRGCTPTKVKFLLWSSDVHSEKMRKRKRNKKQIEVYEEHSGCISTKPFFLQIPYPAVSSSEIDFCSNRRCCLKLTIIQQRRRALFYVQLPRGHQKRALVSSL